MTGPQHPAHLPDPVHRASHDDREQVVEQLGEAAGDGRIDLAELEERVERAYAAKTYAELAPLTVDLLPAADPRLSGPLELTTLAGSLKQDGYWEVPRQLTARSDKGSIVIDFTEAVCRHREVVLDVDVHMGNVEVVVPRGWSVTTHGVMAGFGSVKNRATDAPAPGSPVLRVLGQVSMSSVRIRYSRRGLGGRWRWSGRR
ncbi:MULTISPECIES: DUF1707 domain-containing protein [Kitasatospora]|uniref:DUF1707 domain-containing protein n=1 Tax=Kitasatospora cystarginea TaxID=58350 RepID=A0ABN3ERR3_9ACTN